MDAITILLKGNYADATLRINNFDNLPCHKSILAARCKYFVVNSGPNFIIHSSKANNKMQNFTQIFLRVLYSWPNLTEFGTVIPIDMVITIYSLLNDIEFYENNIDILLKCVPPRDYLVISKNEEKFNLYVNMNNVFKNITFDSDNMDKLLAEINNHTFFLSKNPSISLTKCNVKICGDRLILNLEDSEYIVSSDRNRFSIIFPIIKECIIFEKMHRENN